MYQRLNEIDLRIAAWMDRYCQLLMRLSLGLIFIWFGALKPLGMSPEEELIRRTIYWLPHEFVFPVLGIWEVAIGVGLVCQAKLWRTWWLRCHPR
ncbi:hypothetical protein GF1_04060 [Desulfolithobacter dissulfuricans]|uniref:DoxX family protein n=1 Tax=Desulfolithobacter dissulfuricans TaxID=2795293 RepID=A0A915U953_9BACT|nr:hypothetical protein [Desulfolithobacter dissulfuricans]BCO08030.1 hypothetical protein GF1_04060 [Desulfolithobacter dissulfuricans]